MDPEPNLTTILNLPTPGGGCPPVGILNLTTPGGGCPPVGILNLTTPGGGCPPVGIQLEGLILPPMLSIDVILGLLGNIVALWIFCFRIKAWNTNNLFLFNLVIADFLALASLPLRIDALLRGYWVFGDGICRINLFLMFSNRTASIAFMTVVAVYRYFKVVHPHHCLVMTKRRVVLVTVLLWLVVISPRVPMLAFNHIKGSGNTTQCFFFTSYKEASSAIIILVAVHRVLTVLEFILPMILLLFCSIQIYSFLKQHQTMGKPHKLRKAMRMCAVIIAVFMVCFLPTTVTTVGVWVIRSYRPWDCSSFYTFTQLTIVSLGLNFLNSALDPVVYVFSSSTFRKALLAATPRALLCRKDGDQNSASMSTTQSTNQQEMRFMREAASDP
ncbi:hydroxycarboxylic acid receptor 2-like [Cololabis saira]|uniref:hydroxycarboxylic acid receptor 2-like n=1 Tax=Cololabis saira TaxID=129043 RepID=UPI002AD44145|nr:hydroxycarboxylic acid receptor 2-like [Cololabis saira]